MSNISLITNCQPQLQQLRSTSSSNLFIIVCILYINKTIASIVNTDIKCHLNTLPSYNNKIVSQANDIIHSNSLFALYTNKTNPSFFGIKQSAAVCKWKIRCKLILLLLCGDIEQNPEPRDNSTYPCVYCQIPVDWGQQAICSEECNVWLHKSCIEMCTNDYCRFAEKSSLI